MESNLVSPYIQSFFQITINSITLNNAIELVVIVLLLIASALISGSEVAYFSLKPADLNTLKEKNTDKAHLLLSLLDKSEKLLATILVANNFINIAIVIISTYLTSHLFVFESTGAQFLFQVIIITFILLLFGEIIPKLIANHKPVAFALLMTYPLKSIIWLFSPVTNILLKTSGIFKQLVPKQNQQFSIDELSHAIELTEDNLKDDEERILQSIVNFSNIEVRQIMKSRVDVIALSIKTPFNEVIETINKYGYSRIPVFQKDFDNVQGILFIKDLLPHLGKGQNFHWQSLIRPPYFIHESKKINELLQEFQAKKIHLAVIIDEYGGTSGIVTLEDILEEIIGEISDELDNDRRPYQLISKNKYVFEAKILLQDFCKILDIDFEIFNDINSDIESLAGLLLKIKGGFPEQNEIIRYKNLLFKIKSIDQRRIKEIIVEKLPTDESQ